MGLFFDLLQQSQLNRQAERATDLAGRIAILENELRHTQKLLHDVIVRLEQKIGTDLDQDGKVG